MLIMNSITARLGGQTILDGATASLPPRSRVGIVGRNGAGKSTLLKIIAGELQADDGAIETPRGTRIGYVAQEAPGGRETPFERVLAADEERVELLQRAEEVSDPTDIAEVHDRLNLIDAHGAPARASRILAGLGFDEEAQHQPLSSFSGGWRMRVALAAVLFSEPDLLLLDEPTNYLDLEGALWLESYLSKYPHTVVIVSHDRGLLNRAVGSILHLEDRKLSFYQTPYDQFAEARAAKIALAEAENARAKARVAHLQSFVDRFRYKASKAVQAQSRLKMIERIKLISTPQEAALRAFTFPEPEELSPPILATDGVAVGYGERVVLDRLTLRIDQDDRIALLGRNGEGKSTLSKLFAERLPAMKGKMTRAGKLRVGYFAQHQVDELRVEETPLDHLRRLRPDEAPAKWRARLSGFGLQAAQAETEVGRLSGGQKARLSLLLATIDAPHMLILDEPTNHLDIESREALVEALTAYTGAVILVSHDMHLLSLVADRLWLVKDGRVNPFEGDLEDYRRMLLASDKATVKTEAAKPKSPKPSRDELIALRSEVRKCEERVSKINEMRDKLATKLADPALYEDARIGELETWNRKYAEIMDGLSRAEALWMAALEKLEEAESR